MISMDGVRVEVSGGLVGEQDQRPVDERPRHGDALLLTTGELLRVAVLLAAEADQLEHLGHDTTGDGLRLPDHLEREGHVLVRGPVRQQPEVLEHAPDGTAEVWDAPRPHTPTSRPFTMILPLLGWISRSSNFTIVDLPEPEGPMKKTNSPFSIETDTSLRDGRWALG
jgi:hypothetical protein